MTRHIVTMAGVIVATSMMCAQATRPQFKTDFSGGIPPEVILVDGDGNTPSTAMANIGFAVGVPWIGYYIEDENEYVACSTSWYKPAGTSDDWMILPAVNVCDGATLRWRARSSDKKYFDGYAVYVSTEGADRDAFNMAEPLFAIEGESNQWVTYEIDLSAFVGKDINVAFVNNSTNKARLYIDDIKVGTDYPLIVRIDTPALVLDSDTGTDLVVKGVLSTEFDDASLIGDVVLRCSGEEITVANADVAAGYVFAFAKSVHLDAGEQSAIEVECTSTGGYSYSAALTVRSTSRPMVVEEFTGTWCSWCIRGIVYLDALKETYGDKVIPMCVHEDDVMEAPEYFRGVDYLTEQSIPNSIVNRKYECDPALLFQYGEMALNEGVKATITAADIDYSADEGRIDADVAVAFGETVYDGSYRLAYVLVEDNIWVPDDARYSQKNAYAGGAAGPMGGFENMPSIIMPALMTYHDVVRSVSDGGPHGIAMSMPGAVQAGEEYHHTYQMQVPETVLNRDELYLVVMVLDNKTNEVLNARRYKLNGNASVCDALSGSAGVDVYTISGIALGHYASEAAFRDSAPRKGLYIIRDGHSASKVRI